MSMSRAEQAIRAAAERRAARDRLETFAQSFRRRAHQQAYAGCDGDYVGNAIAAWAETVSLHWDACPEAVRSAALKVAHYHLDGPSGQRDPRAAGHRALSDGPGY